MRDTGMGELLSLASRNRFVKPRIATSAGTVKITAGTSLVIASFGDDVSEGLVVGFSFWAENEDYTVAPVTIGEVGTQALANNANVPASAYDVFQLAMSPRSVPFFWPDSRGYLFNRGRSVVLSVKNTGAVDLTAEGVLYLLTWAETDRKQAIESLAEERRRLGPAFPEPLFAKGGVS